MTDLSKGIIEIEGMRLSQNTQASDFENITNPNIQVTVSKRGHTYVKFKEPIVADGISMFVNVACYTDSKIPEIELCPAVPNELAGKYVEISKYKVDVSKKWLKRMLDQIPDEDNESVCYSYDWGYIISLVVEDRDYGLRGGEVNIKFRED